MSGRRAVLCALVACASASCTAKKPTQIVLALATDLAIPAELDRVVITIGFAGKPAAEERDVPLNSGADLPATLAINAADADTAAEVAITVVGRLGSAEVVRREVTTRFVKGRSLLLRVLLLRACRDRDPCRAGETCDNEGGCSAPHVDPGALPDYDEDEALRGLEGGADGAEDGGVDAAEAGGDAPGEGGEDAVDGDATDAAAEQALDLGDDGGADSALPDLFVGDLFVGDGGPQVAAFEGPVKLGAMALAADGSLYVTGLVEDTGPVDFGCPPAATSHGDDDLFIAKLDPAGSCSWKQVIGGAGVERGDGIAIDSSGWLHVAGSFTGNTTLGGDPLINQGSHDSFVAVFNAGGGHVWSKAFGGDAVDAAYGVAVDATGNTYVAGTTKSSTITFETGVPLSGGELFLFSVDPAGAVRWGIRFGGAVWTMKVAFDPVDDRACVVATVKEAASFDGGAPLPHAGGQDVAVGCFDADSGDHVWSTSFGGSDDDEARAIAIDGSGNVIVAGLFAGTMDSGALATANLASVGDTDIFMVSLAQGGGLRWANRYGGSGPDRGSGLAMWSATGEVCLAATVDDDSVPPDDADLGGGILLGSGITGLGCYDPEAGTHTWSTRLNEGFGLAVAGSAAKLALGAFPGGGVRFHFFTP